MIADVHQKKQKTVKSNINQRADMVLQFLVLDTCCRYGVAVLGVGYVLQICGIECSWMINFTSKVIANLFFVFSLLLFFWSFCFLLFCYFTICVETCCTLNNGLIIVTINTKLKKNEKLFSLRYKVTRFITFHAPGYPFVRESYSAVKKNATMTGNLYVIQRVFHIVSCGKVLQHLC